MPIAPRGFSFAILLMFVFAMGCEFVPPRPVLKPPKDNKTKAAEAQRRAETVEPPDVGFGSDWEVWYAYYLNNQEVGYSHLKAEAMLDQVIRTSQANIRYTVDDQVRMRVGNGTLVTHLNQVSKETSKGSLLNFESTLQTGPVYRTFSGSVVDNRATVETVLGTNRKRNGFKWETTFRGLHAIDQSLRRKPMELNETRNLDMLLPIQHKVTRIEMFSAGTVGVPLLGDVYKPLTEIVISRREGEKSIPDQVVWVDKDGEIQKRLFQSTGLVAYRIKGPTELSRQIPVDRIDDETVVRVRGSIAQPEKARQVPFIIRPNAATRRVKGGAAIPPGPGQYVRMMKDGSCQVLVAPNDDMSLPGFKTMTQSPTQSDLESSAFIDSSSGDVRRFVKTITVRSESNGSQKQLAMDILEAVSQIIGKTEQSSGLTKASLVAQSLTGDYLETSIFLAASLRAARIPARLVAGLVYVPGDKPRMVDRVWTAAFVDGRWIALDATEGKIASPNRLALVTTSLPSRKEYESLAPAINALGRLDIEIRQVIY